LKQKNTQTMPWKHTPTRQGERTRSRGARDGRMPSSHRVRGEGRSQPWRGRHGHGRTAKDIPWTCAVRKAWMT